MIESGEEQIMTEASARQPASRPAAPPATVGDVMQPALTSAEQDGHLAAAAYLMKHSGATALVVVDDESSRRPIGLITESDIVQAVADGKNVNEVRIRDVMSVRLTAIGATTSIRDAAGSMLGGGFRHLPIVDDTGLVGMVDISDVCRALLDLSVP
jgi:CBS domain-containing protein